MQIIASLTPDIKRFKVPEILEYLQENVQRQFVELLYNKMV